MAQFGVHTRRSGGSYLLDCQANLLSDLNTRIVVPLLPRSESPRPAERLNPVFTVAGEEVVMLTQFAAAVAIGELGEQIGSLEAERYIITNALDMLISGI